MVEISIFVSKLEQAESGREILSWLVDSDFGTLVLLRKWEHVRIHLFIVTSG